MDLIRQRISLLKAITPGPLRVRSSIFIRSSLSDTKLNRLPASGKRPQPPSRGEVLGDCPEVNTDHAAVAAGSGLTAALLVGGGPPREPWGGAGGHAGSVRLPCSFHSSCLTEPLDAGGFCLSRICRERKAGRRVLGREDWLLLAGFGPFGSGVRDSCWEGSGSAAAGEPAKKVWNAFSYIGRSWSTCSLPQNSTSCFTIL